MSEKYYERIKFDGDLEQELSAMLGDYELGAYAAYELIEFGYEDFNLKLTTDQGNYFVKIFAASRPGWEAERCADVMKVLSDAKVKHPKVFTDKSGNVLHTTKNGLQLAIMEFIDGPSLFQQGAPPTPEQKREIIEIIKSLQELDYKPRFIYDSWSMIHFVEEYEKQKHVLAPEDDELVRMALAEFSKIDLDSLPQAFVHGDIISPNLIRSDDGLCIVDFSVANVQPRISELAVLASNLFTDLDDNAHATELRAELDQLIDEITPLTDEEKAAFPAFVAAAHAMLLIGAAKTLYVGDDDEENQFWLKSGRVGLRRDFNL